MAFMTSNRTAKKHPSRSSFDDQGEYMHDYEQNDDCEFHGYDSPTHFCSGCQIEFECPDFEPTQGCSCTPDDADCRHCKLDEIEHFLANGGDIENIDIGEPVAVASDAPAFPVSQIIDVPTILNQRSSKFMEWIARIATDGDPFAQRLWRETFPEESPANFQARVIREGTYSHDRLHSNVKPLYIRQLESLLVQHEQWTRTSVMRFPQLVEICGAAYNLVEQTEGCRMTHPYKAPVGPEVHLARAVERMERRERIAEERERERARFRALKEQEKRVARKAREARIAEKHAIAEQIIVLRARVRAIKEEERVVKVARPNWG